jgi:hypothetical protein
VTIREINDGNWYVGYAKSDIFKLEYNGTEQLHFGVVHAWRTSGDAMLGLSLGRHVSQDIAPILTLLGLEKTAKFIYLAKEVVSIEAYGGFRPIHSPDVHDWAYGVGVVLQKSFGLPDLTKGL